MLGTDEVKAVVIVIDPIVDADVVELHDARLNDTHRMKSTLIKEDVTDSEVLAAMKEEMIGPLCSSSAGRGRSTTLRTAKLRALSVDGSWSFDRNVFGINGEDQAHIAVP